MYFFQLRELKNKMKLCCFMEQRKKKIKICQSFILHKHKGRICFDAFIFTINRSAGGIRWKLFEFNYIFKGSLQQNYRKCVYLLVIRCINVDHFGFTGLVFTHL